MPPYFSLTKFKERKCMLQDGIDSLYLEAALIETAEDFAGYIAQGADREAIVYGDEFYDAVDDIIREYDLDRDDREQIAERVADLIDARLA